MVVSTDPAAPLAVIIGITGKQGGSVATHLIDSPKPYRITGLTRDTSNLKAQAFAQKGVTLNQVDITPGNEEAVVEAFRGADILFAMTNSAALLGYERELAQGKLMVDSAKAAGVKLFIWSSAEHLKKVTNGRLSVFAFDVNGEITDYLIASGLSYILADGTYVLSLPVPKEVKVPMLDTPYDYGLWVRAAIESEGVDPGGEVLTGYPISFEDQMAALSEYIGKTFKYHEVKSKEEWITLKAAWQPFASIFWDFWVFIAEYGYYNGKDLEASNKAAGVTPPKFTDIIRRHKPDNFLID